MRAPGAVATSHEHRLARRALARGEEGQVEALLGLKGTLVGGRHRIESLYAVGGEGAVFLTRDLREPSAPPRVAKIALLPIHRPFELDARVVRKQRESLRIETRYLQGSGSRSMPRYEGSFEFENPLLDPARGDAFAEPEPVLLMEKLPGLDLDRWLARTHRSDVPPAQMRRTLDRVAVVLLQGLVDLWDRGFLYADLRPANLRILGRPERIVRLLDAGSLVAIQDRSGRFPHVPSYLPPALFRERVAGRRITPSPETQAIMAGRTLYEVATGRVPHPGEDVDERHLDRSLVSPPVAEVVAALCRGDFEHVRHALRYLERRAQRRVQGGNDPQLAVQRVPDRAPAPGVATSVAPVHEPPARAPAATNGRAHAAAATPPARPDAGAASQPSPRTPAPPTDARPRRGLLARLFGWIR